MVMCVRSLLVCVQRREVKFVWLLSNQQHRPRDMVDFLGPIVSGKRGVERCLLLLPAALGLAGGKLYSPMLLALSFGVFVSAVTVLQGFEARERHLNSALTSSLVAVLFFVGERDPVSWTLPHQFLVATAALSYLGAVASRTWGLEWYAFMGCGLAGGGMLSGVFPSIVEIMARPTVKGIFWQLYVTHCTLCFFPRLIDPLLLSWCFHRWYFTTTFRMLVWQRFTYFEHFLVVTGAGVAWWGWLHRALTPTVRADPVFSLSAALSVAATVRPSTSPPRHMPLLTVLATVGCIRRGQGVAVTGLSLVVAAAAVSSLRVPATVMIWVSGTLPVAGTYPSPT